MPLGIEALVVGVELIAPLDDRSLRVLDFRSGFLEGPPFAVELGLAVGLPLGRGVELALAVVELLLMLAVLDLLSPQTMLARFHGLSALGCLPLIPFDSFTNPIELGPLAVESLALGPGRRFALFELLAFRVELGGAAILLLLPVVGLGAPLVQGGALGMQYAPLLFKLFAGAVELLPVLLQGSLALVELIAACVESPGLLFILGAGVL